MQNNVLNQLLAKAQRSFPTKDMTQITCGTGYGNAGSRSALRRIKIAKFNTGIARRSTKSAIFPLGECSNHLPVNGGALF